jgi:hypothetical protein
MKTNSIVVLTVESPLVLTHSYTRYSSLTFPYPLLTPTIIHSLQAHLKTFSPTEKSDFAVSKKQTKRNQQTAPKKKEGTHAHTGRMASTASPTPVASTSTTSTEVHTSVGELSEQPPVSLSSPWSTLGIATSDAIGKLCLALVELWPHDRLADTIDLDALPQGMLSSLEVVVCVLGSSSFSRTLDGARVHRTDVPFSLLPRLFLYTQSVCVCVCVCVSHVHIVRDLCW